MHITVDGYGGSAEALADKRVIRAFLDSYPQRIGMTKIAQPYITEYEARNPDDAGVTGFVIIAESHISIHTFPHRRFVWVDIFSCKGFDAEPSLEFVRQTFDLQHMEVHTLQRGFEYPHTAAAAAVVATQERAVVAAGVGSQVGA
jgi:S-adenosylmethionine decarboxylase